MSETIGKILDQIVPWRSDGYYEKLRYEYKLDKNSVCIDLGAFHCEWGIKISDMYSNPTIYAFEPINHIYDIGLLKIEKYNNIKLFNYGAGKENYEADIIVGEAQGVSSSFYLNEASLSKTKVEIKSIKNIFQELNISNVDLIKINIEGSEYDVLECLIDNNLQTKIKNIQVQFHRLSENYNERYLAIKNKLSETHKLTYEFPFIWENWELTK